jgi:hypothetical protein
MSDQAASAPSEPKEEREGSEAGLRPHPTPILFIDGIAAIAPTSHVVRLTMFRADPDPNDGKKPMHAIIGQLIIPIDEYVQMSAFLNDSVEKMVSEGLIDRQAVTGLRAQVVEEK